ncbi:MAG TPA: hypothetical protein VFN67_31200 [Polyangiales bacterium]|nr:hypothetical protein [Polyangiales bacterium]
MVAGIDDAELLARIRGQTRDLPISLITDASPALSRPSAARLQNIANEHAADFVVSVEQEPSGARVVYVLDARASELRVRAAPAPQRRHRFARSAVAETVALIVRGELADALAARASQSKERPSSESSAASNTTQPGRSAPANAARSEASQEPTRTETTPQPQSKPRPKQPEPEPRKPEQEPRDEHEPEAELEPENPWHSDGPPNTWFIPTQVSLELAGRVSTPITGRYFTGGSLSLRCTFESISIGVTGATSLANRAHIQGLTLRLREHAIGFDAFVHLPLPAGFYAALGASGRWLFYQRNASSGDVDWQPEPADTSTTFAVGPQLELRWQLAEHLGVGVRFGLDVLLKPVSWRYRLDTNRSVPVELEHQNRTEPWLSLGIYGSL